MASGPNPGGKPLDREIDDALEGMNLQEIDMEPRAGKAGDKGAPRLHPGTIVGITDDDVFVELGPRSQGVISLREFDEPPEVGAVFQFTLRGKDDDLMLLSLKEARTIAAWNDLTVGAIVKAHVSGQNTGGLELKVGPLDAFMPASHAARRRVEDLSAFIGQSLLCEVLESDPARKRILLSRRNVLERENQEARERAVGELAPGQVVKGKVTRLESFGAFVDIGGGLEGLVHVSNLSFKRVEHPEEVVKVGDAVEAQVLDIKEGGKRIGLGIKQLAASPWDDIATRVPVDSVVTGKVTRLMDFGAFVELEPGIEGLLHVSQITTGRVRRVQEAIKVGEETSVRVLSIDPVQQRISLTRLDSRGAIIGSEEAVDESTIGDVLSDPGSSLKTNLGDLFRKAMEDE